MKQKLLKLIKTLKTFKKEDLLSVLEDDSFDLDSFLNQLISQKMIKEIGINMYAFIGDLEKKLNKNHIKVNPNVNKWLSVNFKGDIKNINFNKINPVTFFDDETYGKIYEEANDESKANIVRNYSLMKLASTYSGRELAQFLFDISKINPDLKISYSGFIAKKRHFKQRGIDAFLKKDHIDKNVRRYPQEILDEFEKMYLSSDKYSYKHCVAILKTKYGKEFIPTSATLSRYMNSKYTPEELLAKRKNSPKEIINKFYDINRTAKSLPNKLFYKFTLDYMERQNLSQASICSIRRHIIPFFGDYNIDDITPELAMKFQSEMLKEGLAIGTIKSVITTLNSILLCYTGMKYPLMLKSNKLLPILETEVLNEQEIKDLIKNKSAGLWILLLGISLQELVALDYSRIDFSNQSVHINRTFCNRSIRLHRELYQMRILKLHPLLIDLLDKGRTEGLIYESLDIKNSNVLQNTYVKLMLDNNVSIHIIYKKLGLKNLDMFISRYGFLLDNEEPQVDILKGMY